ncbi:hypothetical protein ACFPU1_03840 [Thalassorhabdus alkalitolerans]|uniref:Uncharacterized protein n=1 Tax=Thalassorhabdus alkalitolerans TaxID=2282697 RepID=A0ABW0YHJ8_9BACI|nr:hypothetical protein [Bacillus sp. FJAT-44742]
MIKKWWFWLLVVLFIVINISITNMSNDSDAKYQNDRPHPLYSDIPTH